MRELVVVPAREGEVVGDSPERRVEILCDDGALNVTWSRFGPDRDGADLHVHRNHSDLFYVLSGELTLRLGIEGDPVALTAGSLVRVPTWAQMPLGVPVTARAGATVLDIRTPG